MTSGGKSTGIPLHVCVPFSTKQRRSVVLCEKGGREAKEGVANKQKSRPVAEFPNHVNVLARMLQ